MKVKDGALRKEAALDELVPDSQVAIAGDVRMRHMRLHRKSQIVDSKFRRMAQSNYVAVAKMIENLDKILADAQELQAQTGSEFLGEITKPAQGMKQALIQAFEQISQIDVVNDAFDQQQNTGPMTQGQPVMPTQGEPMVPTASRLRVGGWDKQLRPELVEATVQALSQGDRPLEEVGAELQQSGWSVEDVEKAFDEGLEKGLWDMSKKGMDLWLSLRPQTSTGMRQNEPVMLTAMRRLAASDDWTCPNCGAVNTDDPYPSGEPRPQNKQCRRCKEPKPESTTARLRIKRVTGGLREAKWEITNLDSGKTQYVEEEEAISMFGKDEWNEISQGYAPNIVAVEVDYGSEEEMNEWWDEKTRSGGLKLSSRRGRSPKGSARQGVGRKIAGKITVIWSPRSAPNGNFYMGEGEWNDPNEIAGEKFRMVTREELQSMGVDVGDGWGPGEYDVFETTTGAVKKRSARLDQSLRQKVNGDFGQAGLDGNGRFRSTGDITNTITGVLEQNGLEFDAVVSADTYREPEGNATFDIAFKTDDPFSPESIENSMVSIYWYTHEEESYEAVVYLS